MGCWCGCWEAGGKRRGHHPTPNPNLHARHDGRQNKLPMLHEKQRLAKQEGMAIGEVDTYMRRWRNAEREAKALHKFTEVGC